MQFENDPIADFAATEIGKLKSKGVVIEGGSQYNRIFELIYKLQSSNEAKDREIERLKAELELYEQRENDPYWYWPQCDVDECKGVSCNGGGCWRETGYWSVCSKHSTEFREGKPQPKMKEEAIKREASRDKDGYLPTIESQP